METKALITLHEIDGAPLVLDTDLAAALGFAHGRQIRELISRHREELEGYGPLSCATTMVEIGSGAKRAVTAYQLNEEQALLICMLSRTPKARAIRIEVIQVYMAWRKGKLKPAAPAIPQDYATALRLAADEHERRLALEATLNVTQAELEAETEVATRQTERAEAMSAVFEKQGENIFRFLSTLVGVNRIKFHGWLAQKGILYRHGYSGYRVYSRHRDKFLERADRETGRVGIGITAAGKDWVLLQHRLGAVPRLKSYE